MSKLLNINDTLDLLGNLRGTFREFADTEERINREFRNSSEASDKRFQAQIAAIEKDLEVKTAAAQQEFASAKEATEKRFQQRKERIARAHLAAKKRGSGRIDAEEGRRKYHVQKGMLDTEKWRADSLAQNDAAFAQFQGQLATESGAVHSLRDDAARRFRGYRKFVHFLREPAKAENSGADEHAFFQSAQRHRASAAEKFNRFRRLFIPAIFKFIPLWVWIVLSLGITFGLYPALQKFSITGLTKDEALWGGIGLAILALAGYIAGLLSAAPLAREIARDLSAAQNALDFASQKAQSTYATETARIKSEAANRVHAFEQEWQHALAAGSQSRETLPAGIDEKWKRVSLRNDRFFKTAMARLDADQQTALKNLQEATRKELDQIRSVQSVRKKELTDKHDETWAQLVTQWRSRIDPMLLSAQESATSAKELFRDWTAFAPEQWRPPADFLFSVKFGSIEVDIRKYAGTTPHDPRLSFSAGETISLPLALTFPRHGSILFETTNEGKEPVIGALNNLMFRLLAASPVGKISFTIFDPVKLGENFSGITHLADYEANLINGRIWTQPEQLEERLAELNEHMEKVIQMYLRNEYADIAEYNKAAGNIAEKYHFVVIADFPVNLSESAARKLLRIASSGARCGVYTLIHWDHRHVAAPEYLLDELRKSCIWVKHAGSSFALTHPFGTPAKLLLDSPPPPQIANTFLERVGELSRGSNQVQVPFAQVAPPEKELWSLSSAEELRVPIGRSGANKLQYLSLGRGTRQHALVAGKTGSGKSTLFHVLITNLGLWSSPDEVEFYLVDFKKGVEFRSYAAEHLPHARVVAIESDREFGLSVLQRVDEELRHRGELFRKAGAQEISSYRKTPGALPMPRTLLIIDEFQEFFVEEDRVSQTAAMLLDRIVRQGRAFGIHVLLGSQTLGGAYTLARTTIGQMVIRIALQCNEADAYLIMDENNPAPRLLSRPGEGIYNDMAGTVEGNSPFQTVWLSEAERAKYLRKIRKLAEEKGKASIPIVFEGNAPADIRENELLRDLIAIRPTAPPETARMWLGAPNAIKSPTEAVFRSRSGSNLLIVGQREESNVALLVNGLLALAAQYPAGKAKFIVLDATSGPGTQFQELAQKLPHPLILGGNPEAPQIVQNLAEADAGDSPSTFLFVNGLQNFKKLRAEDEFNYSLDAEAQATPAALFTKLISDGPSRGLHVIAAIDTYNNVNRFFGRKGLTEFEMRVLFQMSSNDSASLCDSPKANMLGLHRALYYNEQEGTLETHRPYALPEKDWLEQTLKILGSK